MSSEPTDTPTGPIRPADVTRAPGGQWRVTSVGARAQRLLGDRDATRKLVVQFGHTYESARDLLETVAAADPLPVWPMHGGPRLASFRGIPNAAGTTWAYQSMKEGRRAWTLTYDGGQWWATLPPIPEQRFACGAHHADAEEHATRLYADAVDRADYERDLTSPEAVYPGQVLVLSGALRMVMRVGTLVRTPGRPTTRAITFLEHEQIASFDIMTILETATVEEWRNRWARNLFSITSSSPEIFARMPIREAQ